MFRRFVFASLLMGVSHSSQADTIVFTDLDPVAGSVVLPYQAYANELLYTHDINDDGYDPVTDEIIDATLSIHLGVEFLTARAVYDYEAQDESELSFAIDDILTVLYMVDEGWWFAYKYSTDTAGLFPSNYVEAIELRALQVETMEISAITFPPSFQVSFDGDISPDIHPVTSSVHEFTVPEADLIDGSLNLGVHLVDGFFAFNYSSLSVTVERTVPEPSTILLLGTGLIVLSGLRNRSIL